VRFCTHLAFLICLTPAMSLGQENLPLENLKQIRQLGDTAIGHAVDFRATVTYSDPVYHFIFVEDGEQAIFLHGRRGEVVERGDRVRVHGKVQKGDVLPTIGLGWVTVDSDEKVSVTPMDVDLRDLSIGDFDCRYVSVKCEVIQILLGSPISLFYCKSGDREFYVSVAEWGLDIERAHKYIGRRVKIDGCLGVQFVRPPYVAPGTPLGHPVAHRLFCDSPDDITVLDGKKPRYVATNKSIGVLLQSNRTEGCFSTYGQISLAEIIELEDGSRSHQVVLCDTHDAVRLHVRSAIDLGPGMIARVYGKRRKTDTGLCYEADIIHSLSHSGLQSPPITSLDEAVAEYAAEPKDLLNHRVCVEGVPVSILDDVEHSYLRLKGELHQIDVKLPGKAREALAFASPDVASRVRIHGIAVPAELDDAELDFQLVLNHADEVELVSKRIANNRVVMMGVAALAFAVLLSLAWVKTLRVRVAEKTQDALHSTAQLRSSYDAIEDGVLALDERANTLAVNSEFLRVTGHPMKVGHPIKGLVDAIAEQVRYPHEFLDFWNDCLQNPESTRTIELEFVQTETSTVVMQTTPICAGGDIIGRLVILRDETVNRRLQAELLHANKLEAVGRLVGGVAHDFNNILLAIAANLTIAKFDEKIPVRDVVHELTVAEEAAFRGAKILRKLLTFSSKTELQLRPHRINEIIESLAELIRHTFDASIAFEFELDPSDPMVMAESTALEQVLLNLYVNARDAMPNGGTVVTSTKLTPNPGTGDDVVVISVSDDGVGISDEIRDKIFEPYFTTKDSDNGTGLGLSVSYRVVQQHGGSIHAKPGRDGGTEFQLILPTTNEAARPEPPRPEELPRGSGTILVVDDEDIVRAVAQTMLRRQGYRTIAASNGTEALHYLGQDNHDINAVLLDVTMPGKSGNEVLSIVKEKWPQVPVILCSGYLVGQTISTANFSADAQIAKPYSMQQLIETVHSVLSKGVAA